MLMPIVFGCFATAGLGLMGVPPLAGFTSKWMLATSAVGLGEWIGYLAAAALILSALLTALYLMQIVLLAFFPPAEPAAHGPGTPAGPTGPRYPNDFASNYLVGGVGGPGSGGQRPGRDNPDLAGRIMIRTDWKERRESICPTCC